jgi:Domain of unknown function (DUF1735)/Domain of unknown function (DUF4361)
MKRLLLTSSLFAAMAVMFTSCLKDKGFENGTYGINDPDTAPPGVGFPLSVKKDFLNTVGVNVSTSTQPVNGVVYVTLLAGQVASSDVHVTIALNDALRTAYNAANNPDLVLLPASLYNLSTTITIPAGQRNAQIPINVLNTTTLDPNSAYAIGITITGVDGGYSVADNLKNLLIKFNVKNQYHGEYESTGYFYHPSSPRPLHEDKEVLTSGANSVDVYLGDLGTAGYVGRFTVDPVTNNLTITPAPGAQGAPYTQFNSALPSTNPGYTPGWAGSALCVNKYDPATKTFFVRYGYVGGTGWRVTEEHIVKYP